MASSITPLSISSRRVFVSWSRRICLAPLTMGLILSGALVVSGCTAKGKSGSGKTEKASKKKNAKGGGTPTATATKNNKGAALAKNASKTPVRPPRPTKLMKPPVKPPQLAGSHILIAYKGARRAKASVTRSKAEALKLAKTLTAKLKKAPKSFAAVAKKYSDGPSATKGGSLGVWRKGRMVPAFDKAISALAVGEISKEPVETPFGYHVMRRDPLPALVSGAHILIAYKGARRAKASVTRSEAEAKKLAAKIAAELKKDPSKWGAYVLKYSDGPAAKHGGMLGTWPKGRSHPVFDKEIGSIKVGQIAGPAKTAFGYHVFRRLAVPQEFAGAHILIAYKGARRAAPYITRSKEAAKKLATELAQKITKDPASFEELALKNSDGPSARYGGDLGTWRAGMMAPAFDTAMKKLKVGEVTAAPVETPFGFHIIKRKAVKSEGSKASGPKGKKGK